MEVVEKAGVHRSKDEELLATLGYKQEFRREFSWLELLGLSFSIIGIVQSGALSFFTIYIYMCLCVIEPYLNSSVLVYSLPYGGPVAMVWGVGLPLNSTLLPDTIFGRSGSSAAFS